MLSQKPNYNKDPPQPQKPLTQTQLLTRDTTRIFSLQQNLHQISEKIQSFDTKIDSVKEKKCELREQIH